MNRKKGFLALAALSLLVSSIAIISVSAAPQFADVGFKNTWERVDKPVDEVPNVGRGYVWGPVSIAARTEQYNNQPRTVQYFDKARMEVNNPQGDRNDLYFVTTGLLVKELVTGLQQDGDNTFTPLVASTIQVAGDPNDNGANPEAPTYSSFKDVVTFTGSENGVPERTGGTISQFIDKSGRVTTISARENRTVTGYDPLTQHNIADVFVTYGQNQGLIWSGSAFVQGSVFFGNPTYVFGRPVTEPYWIRAQVNGVTQDILVQLFERRVLTYTPANAEKDRVEMGNVGQHYYRWRYQQNNNTGTPTAQFPPQPSVFPPPASPQAR